MTRYPERSAAKARDPAELPLGLRIGIEGLASPLTAAALQPRLPSE